MPTVSFHTELMCCSHEASVFLPACHEVGSHPSFHVAPAAEPPPKRPSLVRHSISRAPPLALEASDAAAEMQDPAHKVGPRALCLCAGNVDCKDILHLDMADKEAVHIS